MTAPRYVSTYNFAPHFIELVALRKTGKGEGWAWCSSERVGDDFLVEVCQHRPLKSGPRKGRRTFFGERIKCIVTHEEVRAEELRYERETGKCYRCNGCGMECYGHSEANGYMVRNCVRCNATGIAAALNAYNQPQEQEQKQEDR